MLALLAVGVLVAVAPSHEKPTRATLGHSSPSTTARSVTTTTTAQVSTAVTSTAVTSTARQVPTTPSQALAAARAALEQAQAGGRLDPGAAKDLQHRLDDLAKALGKGNPNDAVNRLADLRRHLADLVNAGQLSGTGIAAITSPLDELAALLPAVPGPGEHGPKGDGKKHEH
jgi:hypothetical protein